MVVLFIVVGNEAIKCLGARFCEPFSSVLLVQMWQYGLIELMFEMAGLKIYRRKKDKISREELKERLDKKL